MAEYHHRPYVSGSLYQNSSRWIRKKNVFVHKAANTRLNVIREVASCVTQGEVLPGYIHVTYTAGAFFFRGIPSEQKDSPH